MSAEIGQILLLSDNPQTVASLEGALRPGQFRLHPLDRTDRLEQQIPSLLTTVDAAIVDGTAPLFSNGRLEKVLTLLDNNQLGAVVLYNPAGPAPAFAGHLPLAWTVAVDNTRQLAATLKVIAGYQQVVRQLHREIKLFQRLDARLSGQFNEIDEEMRLASRIQRDFLPKQLPAVGPVQFATLYRPASWVSGDIYDVFRLDEKHVGFYVADAVGHGMPAALLTMFIKRSMETKQINPQGYQLLSPAQTMGVLNRALLEASLSTTQFTTAIYAIVNIETLEVRFSRGGHPHPLWLHADGTTTEPEVGGGLLGVFDDTEFELGTVQLAPGDKFILYSDGLETVFVEEGQVTSELYRERITAMRHLPAAHMLQQMVQEMDRQAGSLNPRDDVTLVVMDVAG
ncbi:MAG: hypothetical protein BIFFINMI_01487 [Phycisphaerae bacterium]|nr:hypothetical protein [Phycisphaerae bacterium]